MHKKPSTIAFLILWTFFSCGFRHILWVNALLDALLSSSFFIFALLLYEECLCGMRLSSLFISSFCMRCTFVVFSSSTILFFFSLVLFDLCNAMRDKTTNDEHCNKQLTMNILPQSVDYGQCRWWWWRITHSHSYIHLYNWVPQQIENWENDEIALKWNSVVNVQHRMNRTGEHKKQFLR